MTLLELDPDHLDTLETWDTGLPRVLYPRDGLAGTLVSLWCGPPFRDATG